MTDRYQSFTGSPLGKLFVKNLGLPNPTELERWSEGAPVVDGTVLTGGEGRLGTPLRIALDNLGVTGVGAAAQGEKYKGLVFDATGIVHSTDLVALEQFFTPLMRSLSSTPASWSSAPSPNTATATTSGSRSAPSRASPARSARRSAGAAPSTWCTSLGAPRTPSSPRSRSSCHPRAPTSPARSPVSVPPARPSLLPWPTRRSR